MVTPLDRLTNIQQRSTQLVVGSFVQGLLRAHRRGELQDLRQDLREGDGGLCIRSILEQAIKSFNWVCFCGFLRTMIHID